MVVRPCLMCGKEVEAEGGHNTVYSARFAATYACHTRRSSCDGQPGAYDTAVKLDRLAQLSTDARERHHVPAAEVEPPRRRSWFRRR